jgi:RING finger protein 113A
MFKKREKKTTGISILEKKDEITVESNDNQTDYTQSKDNPLNLSQNDFLNKKRLFTSSNLNNQFSTKTSSENSQIKNMLDDMKFKSTYSLKNDSQNATRELEITQKRQRLRNEMIAKDKLEGKISTDQYMGKDATISYIQKSERDISRYKVTGSMGPMRAPSNVRVTCRFDYAHGICKDYKETGYCGFGDNCVFVHDRSDYKTGWELEEEWKREEIKKQKLLKEGKKLEDEEDHDHDESETHDSENNSIPLECPICESEFFSPVSTKCLHYYCEKCALKHYSKSSLCYVCKKPTQGIFNNAEKIIEKIKLKKKKAKKVVDKINKILPDANDDVLTSLNGETELNLQSLENKRSYYDNMDYLTDKDNRKFQSTYLNLEEDEDDYGFKNYKSKEVNLNSNKQKKNKFKTQNELEFISDYKSY